jgi:hypothetical protein
MKKDELIEQLAEKEHVSWANWMAYFFSKCEHNPDGSLTVPSGYVAALQKQIDASYADLSEQEKQYDKDEVAKILPIIEKYTDEKLQNAVVKTVSRGGLVNPTGNPLARGY